MTTPPLSAQTASPSYRLPVEDQDFLKSDEMRAMRFAMEFAKAEICAAPTGACDRPWWCFGSARIPPPDLAEALAGRRAAGTPRPGARRSRRLAPWYDKARAFARIVSLRGGALAADGPARRGTT